jgi:hypothetical protein
MHSVIQFVKRFLLHGKNMHSMSADVSYCHAFKATCHYSTALKQANSVRETLAVRQAWR